MIRIEAVSEGLLLAVKARPGSRRNAVVGEQEGALKLAVQAAPEKGKANKALSELLASVLGLKKSQVTLVRGETASDKVFRITGVTQEWLAEAIDSLLADLKTP